MDHPQNWTDLITEGSKANQNRGQIVQAAQVAAATLKSNATKCPNEGVRIWKGPSADQPEPLPPITENQVDSGFAMERDFTTLGMPSGLRCPFASMAGKQLSSHAASIVSRYRSSVPSRSSASRFTSQARRSRRPSIEDPIRAEFCAAENLAHTTSPASAAICPIRFLDQHKPEEVAEYFEKHKHEVPRSHEICVKRYQTNAESIRQLDAKYGNLVSMIQGLGAKHQSMLPETPPHEEVDGDKESADKIQKWATTVSADLENAEEKGDGEGDQDDRQPHFERSLKDIRLGESPSRPWGISVPPKFDQSASVASSKPAEIPNSNSSDNSSKEVNAETEKNSPSHCPFRQRLEKEPSAEQHKKSVLGPGDQGRDGHHKDPPQNLSPKLAGTSSSQPQMLFTGPVFIGYPVDQALAMAQQGQRKT